MVEGESSNAGRDFNPFQAPESIGGEVVFAAGSDESIRQEHLSHEASVKSIGSLYGLGAILLTIGVVALFLEPAQLQWDQFSVLVFLSGLSVAVAVGLSRLKSWARWIAVVLAAIGLLAAPLGTLINGYILYLLLSGKGKMVFSQEYQKVIEATPHIKYQTSKLLVVLFVLLVAIILLGIGAAVFG